MVAMVWDLKSGRKSTDSVVFDQLCNLQTASCNEEITCRVQTNSKNANTFLVHRKEKGDMRENRG